MHLNADKTLYLDENTLIALGYDHNNRDREYDDIFDVIDSAARPRLEKTFLFVGTGCGDERIHVEARCFDRACGTCNVSI